MARRERLSIDLIVVPALGLPQIGCAIASARTLCVDNQSEGTRTGVPFITFVKSV